MVCSSPGFISSASLKCSSESWRSPWPAYQSASRRCAPGSFGRFSISAGRKVALAAFAVCFASDPLATARGADFFGRRQPSPVTFGQVEPVVADQILSLIRLACDHLADGLPLQSAQEKSFVVAAEVARGEADFGLPRRFPGLRLRGRLDGLARQLQFSVSEQKADELEAVRCLALNASPQLVAPRVALFEQRLEISLDHWIRRGSRIAHARGELLAQDFQLGLAVDA